MKKYVISTKDEPRNHSKNKNPNRIEWRDLRNKTQNALISFSSQLCKDQLVNTTQYKTEDSSAMLGMTLFLQNSAFPKSLFPIRGTHHNPKPAYNTHKPNPIAVLNIKR